MRVVVTRPEADARRTATALRAKGHEVLVAPLMKVESVAADLSGNWGAVIITSANAPIAVADNPARDALRKLPLVAVGQRSAEAAHEAGFTDVTSAGGDVQDLVRDLRKRRLHALAVRMDPGTDLQPAIGREAHRPVIVSRNDRHAPICKNADSMG